MPGLITDEMLAQFVVIADNADDLAEGLKQRYEGLADRITLYIPYVPGDKDDFWKSRTHALNN